MANWTQVAPQLNAQREIHDHVIIGADLYAVTASTLAGFGGRLFRWNGVNAWVEIAPALVVGGVGTFLFLIACVTLAGEIYALTYGSISENGGRLLKYNGAGAWTWVAQRVGGAGWSLIVHNNEIYASIYNSVGYSLVKWDGTALFWPNDWLLMAPPLLGQWNIGSLLVYHNEIYGGTWPNGNLFKWNGVNAWVQVAPQLGLNTNIHSLCIHNDEIYATTIEGCLLKWNGVNAWIQMAPQLGAYVPINSHRGLYEFNGKLYTPTTNGRLLEFDAVAGVWVDVIPVQLLAQTVYRVINLGGKLYGGTGAVGNLFRADGVGGGYKRLVNYTRRKTRIGR